MIIGLITFTANGRVLGERLIRTSSATKWQVYDKTAEDAKSWVAREFRACDALVFIGATGIAVRLIAPLLQDKTTDPAVLVLDEAGRFVISLVSGHIGGANALALQIAAELGATSVITTATDLNGVWAADVWAIRNDCVVVNPDHIKHISMALLNNQEIGFYSPFPIIGTLPSNVRAKNKGALGVCVSLDAAKKPFDITLNLVPQIATLGAGCRKNTDIATFEAFVLRELAKWKLSPKALQYIASIDLKKDEPCMLEFAAKFDIAFKIFKAEDLNAVDGNFEPSEFVKQTTGVDNVCERAAVLASGGELLVGKTTCNGMTLAIAAPNWKSVFDTENT